MMTKLFVSLLQQRRGDSSAEQMRKMDSKRPVESEWNWISASQPTKLDLQTDRNTAQNKTSKPKLLQNDSGD